MYDTASELHNELLETHFDYSSMNYQVLKENIQSSNNYPNNLFLKTNNYDLLFENEEFTNNEKCVDLFVMPPLEGDEEIKRRKRIKNNKLLTRLPILLVQIKAGNKSCKLKIGIRQILYLLYPQNKITKKVHNNLIKSL